MMNDFQFKTKITREEIALLPHHKFTGRIYYIDSVTAINKVLPELKYHSVLGFDTETKPNFKKGKSNQVALLQLSTSSQAFLFRLNKTGLSNKLIDILIDPSITKAGVAIHDDLAGLKKLAPFQPEGFIDLQEYVKQFGIEDNGLKKLAANILGFQISKRQQTSNWEQEILTEAQSEYAATDAWVCYEIFSALQKLKPYNGYQRENHS
jgi:ribonuclease D